MCIRAGGKLFQPAHTVDQRLAIKPFCCSLAHSLCASMQKCRIDQFRHLFPVILLCLIPCQQAKCTFIRTPLCRFPQSFCQITKTAVCRSHAADGISGKILSLYYELRKHPADGSDHIGRPQCPAIQSHPSIGEIKFLRRFCKIKIKIKFLDIAVFTCGRCQFHSIL